MGPRKMRSSVATIDGQEVVLTMTKRGTSLHSKASKQTLEEVFQEHEELNEESNVDKYGFIQKEGDDIASVFHRSLAVNDKTAHNRAVKEALRDEKWDQMLLDLESGTPKRVENAQKKLGERIRKGIPNCKRGRAWYMISKAEMYREQYPDITMVGDLSKLPQRTNEEIGRDLDRTYPCHTLFLDPDNEKGQKALERILQRYAIIDPEVGYCQGMGFIAALFLIYMPERQAFYSFLSALNRQTEVKLRDLYLPNMKEAQRVLYIFGELGRKHLGKLWEHLVAQDLHPTMYATEWMMTMFCRGFSFDLVTRVMDIFLQEGYKVVYRVALALLKNVEKELMASPFEVIMDILRRIPEYTDANTVMDIAFQIPVKRDQLLKYGSRYDEQHSTDSKKMS